MAVLLLEAVAPCRLVHVMVIRVPCCSVVRKGFAHVVEASLVDLVWIDWGACAVVVPVASAQQPIGRAGS